MCLGRHIRLSTVHCGHTEFISYTVTHITIRSLYHRLAPVQGLATGPQLHRQQTVLMSGKATSKHRTDILTEKRYYCKASLINN